MKADVARVDVGRPVAVDVSRDLDTGVIEFGLYDAAGFSCGGAEFFPDGKVVWTLHYGSQVISGTDTPD